MKFFPGRYEFLDLISPALDHKPEAILALGEWFDSYGEQFWNGERYDASIPGKEPSGAHRLRPIYKWDEENDQGDTIGYDLDGWEVYYPGMEPKEDEQE